MQNTSENFFATVLVWARRSVWTRDFVAGACLFAVALVLRLVFIHETRDIPSFRTFQPGLDIDLTWRAAAHLLENREFSIELMSLSAPLYPWMVAAWRWLFGGSIVDLQIFLAILGALRMPLFFVLCRRSSIATWAAFSAVLLFAVLPALVYFDALPIKVSTEMTILIVLLLLLTGDTPRSRAGLVLRGTILGGLLVMMFLIQRNTFLYAIPVTAYLLLDRTRLRSERAFITVPVTALILAAVVGYRASGASDETPNRFVPRTGVDMAIGNNLRATGVYRRLELIPAYPIGDLLDSRVRRESEVGRRISSHEADVYYQSLARNYVLEHPAHAFKLALTKVAYFFNNEEALHHHYMPLLQEYSWSVGIPVGFGWMTVLGSIGAVNLYRARRHRYLILLAGLVAMLLVANLLTFVTPRTRLPALIPMTLLAGHGLSEMHRLWWMARERATGWRKRLTALLALAIGVAVFAFYPFLEPRRARFMISAKVNDQACVQAERQLNELASLERRPDPTVADIVRRASLLHVLHRYSESYELLRSRAPELLSLAGAQQYVEFLIRLGDYNGASQALSRYAGADENKKLALVRRLRQPARNAALVIILKRPPDP